MEPCEALAAFYASCEPKPSGVVIALSGGADSAALLYAASEVLSPKGVALSACWVHHGLRPEAELLREERLVVGMCMECAAALYKKKIPKGRITSCAADYGGIEAAARHFRYEALREAQRECGADCIYTAHTADDFVETMIMRFCTASGAAGLRGIQEGGAVRRPFLSVYKSEILAYLAASERPYSHDSTNDGNDYMRNKVRHNVVPVLMSVFPSLHTALRTSACKAADDEDALQAYASQLIHGAAIPEHAFDAAPHAVRVRALYLLASALVPDKQRLPWKLMSAAASNTRQEGCLASGAGIAVERRGGIVTVRKAAGKNASELMCAPAAMPVELSFVALDFGEYRIGKAGLCRLYCTDVPKGVRMDAFSWPLCVRARCEGSVLSVVLEDADGFVARMDKDRIRCRRNDALIGKAPCGFLVCEMSIDTAEI